MKTRALHVILLVGLLVRLAVLWIPGGHVRLDAPDTGDYVVLAESLQHGSFQRDGRPEIFRTPGYPLLIAALRTATDHWVFPLVMVQVALDVVLIYLTYRLALMLFEHRAAIVAAALQAICPLVVASSLRVLTDGLFTLVLTGSLLLLVSHVRDGRWWRAIVGAVLLAAACYLRPVGLGVAAVVIIALLVRGRTAVPTALVVAGIVIAALGPWVARNTVTADYVGFSSVAGDSLYHFGAAAVTAETEGLSARQARRQAREIADRRLNDPVWTAGAAARWRRKQALSTIGEHPWVYARIHLVGAPMSLLPGGTYLLEVAGVTPGQRGTVDILHRRGPFAAAAHYFGGDGRLIALAATMTLVPLVSYVGVVVCAVRRLRRRMVWGAWLGVAVAVVLLLAPGPAATPRFRLPIMPWLHVAAGAGLVAMVSRRRQSARAADGSGSR